MAISRSFRLCTAIKFYVPDGLYKDKVATMLKIREAISHKYIDDIAVIVNITELDSQNNGVDDAFFYIAVRFNAVFPIEESGDLMKIRSEQIIKDADVVQDRLTKIVVDAISDLS